MSSGRESAWKAKWRRPEIKDGVPTRWNWVVIHPENLTLGEFVDIGAFTLIVAKQPVTIGHDVQIGSHCSIYTASTIDGKEGSVSIHERAKIGTHSTIMPGVVVGADAVVGAYSLVKTDVPPGMLVYGVPARAHLRWRLLRS